MLEEIGIIIATDGPWAIVAMQRRRTCGQCAGGKHGSVCGTAIMTTHMSAAAPLKMRVHNAIQAHLGCQVVIGIPEQRFLQAATLLYGVPLLTLIIGIIIGQWLNLQNMAIDTELTSLLGGLLGLINGLGWVRYRSYQPDFSTVYTAVILRQYS